MSLSDKLSANLTNAGRTVSQMAKNFSDTNALQKEMTACKRSIQDLYSQIGQLYYEKYNNDPDADFFDKMEEISTAVRRIEEIQTEIQDVQARKPELVKVPDTPKGVKPSAMVCMQCGCTYEAPQEFCSSCGQKLTAQYPSAAEAAMAPSQNASDVQTRPDAAVKPNLTKPADIVLPQQPAQPDLTAETPVTRFCAKCGTKAEPDSVFCVRCGNRLV